MAFSITEILEDFVETGRLSDRIQPEAMWFRRLLEERIRVKEAVKRWCSKAENREKKNAYMRAYWAKPENKARQRKIQKEYRKRPYFKELARGWKKKYESKRQPRVRVRCSGKDKRD